MGMTRVFIGTVKKVKFIQIIRFKIIVLIYQQILNHNLKYWFNITNSKLVRESGQYRKSSAYKLLNST